jgi:hypothetical protein
MDSIAAHIKMHDIDSLTPYLPLFLQFATGFQHNEKLQTKVKRVNKPVNDEPGVSGDFDAENELPPDCCRAAIHIDDDYGPNMKWKWNVQFPGADFLVITFDPNSSMLSQEDYVKVFKEQDMCSWWGEEKYSHISRKSPSLETSSGSNALLKALDSDQFSSSRSTSSNAPFYLPGVDGHPALIVAADHCFFYFASGDREAAKEDGSKKNALKINITASFASKYDRDNNQALQYASANYDSVFTSDPAVLNHLASTLSKMVFEGTPSLPYVLAKLKLKEFVLRENGIKQMDTLLLQPEPNYEEEVEGKLESKIDDDGVNELESKEAEALLEDIFPQIQLKIEDDGEDGVYCDNEGSESVLLSGDDTQACTTKYPKSSADLIVGTRVIRNDEGRLAGKWQCGDKDTALLPTGTVVGGYTPPGWVNVQWDGDGKVCAYRAGADKRFDVLLIQDSPEVKRVCKTWTQHKFSWAHLNTNLKSKDQGATVQKQTEISGDFHTGLGPAMHSGKHEWTISVTKCNNSTFGVLSGDKPEVLCGKEPPWNMASCVGMTYWHSGKIYKYAASKLNKEVVPGHFSCGAKKWAQTAF